MNRDAILREHAVSARDLLEAAGRGRAPADRRGHRHSARPRRSSPTRIDVSEFSTRKRESMEAHASQIADTDFFLAMPEEVFAQAFGTEWFIAHGKARPADAPFGDDLFDPRSTRSDGPVPDGPVPDGFDLMPSDDPLDRLDPLDPIDDPVELPRWAHTGYAQQIVFGVGSLDRLSDVLKSIGVPARVAGDHRRSRRPRDDGARVHAIARPGAGLDVRRGHVARPDPNGAGGGLQARRDGVDGIVSFGGGSCADPGKAVCFFTEQEAGTPGASFADRPVLPHVADHRPPTRAPSSRRSSA